MAENAAINEQYCPFIYTQYLHSTWQPAINSTSSAPTPLCNQKKHSRTLRHAMSCALGRGIGNGGVDTRKAGRCFFTTPPSHCATVMPLVTDHFMELINRQGQKCFLFWGMRTSREERAKAIANQKIAPAKKYIQYFLSKSDRYPQSYPCQKEPGQQQGLGKGQREFINSQLIITNKPGYVCNGSQKQR